MHLVLLGRDRGNYESRTVFFRVYHRAVSGNRRPGMEAGHSYSGIATRARNRALSGSRRHAFNHRTLSGSGHYGRYYGAGLA